MTQVDDLGAGSLQNAAHNVDGGIMAVKEGGGSDDADFVLRLVGSDLRHETTPSWDLEISGMEIIACGGWDMI